VSLFTDLIYGDVRQRDSSKPLRPTSQTSMILAAPLP
jgi:hypothetical protein